MNDELDEDLRCNCCGVPLAAGNTRLEGTDADRYLCDDCASADATVVNDLGHVALLLDGAEKLWPEHVGSLALSISSDSPEGRYTLSVGLEDRRLAYCWIDPSDGKPVYCPIETTLADDYRCTMAIAKGGDDEV